MHAHPNELCILVADDHRDSAEALALLFANLTQAGTRTFLAGDGVEAIDMVCRIRPALVVLDVDMPRMDGLTAGYVIRNLCGSQVVLIAVTGRDSHVAAASFGTVFDAAYLKPLKIEQIVRMVELAAARLAG